MLSTMIGWSRELKRMGKMCVLNVILVQGSSNNVIGHVVLLQGRAANHSYKNVTRTAWTLDIFACPLILTFNQILEQIRRMERDRIYLYSMLLKNNKSTVSFSTLLSCRGLFEGAHCLESSFRNH